MYMSFFHYIHMIFVLLFQEVIKILFEHGAFGRKKAQAVLKLSLLSPGGSKVQGDL